MLYVPKERHGLESLRGVKVNRRVEPDEMIRRRRQKANGGETNMEQLHSAPSSADHSTDDRESEPWASVGGSGDALGQTDMTVDSIDVYSVNVLVDPISVWLSLEYSICITAVFVEPMR